MKVEQIIPNSNGLEDLQNYIAELSSVVRDRSPKSAEKLFERLLTESVGNKASRVLEYIPCTISDMPNNEFEAIKQFFGFFNKDEKYSTNARELLNWGIPLDEVLSYVDFTNYKVFKCETPYFIYGQVSTHNQLTTVSHSQRYAECDRGYYMPPEMKQMIIDIEIMNSGNGDVSEGMFQAEWSKTVNTFSPDELKAIMKKAGIVRKEVFDRGADMLQNRIFVIGGYTNNPNAWQHFLKQRMDKHTQLETQEFANMLHDEIDT